MGLHSIPYFQHDNDMRNDPRIKALRNKFGNEGYSVYCFILEMLTYNQCEGIDLSELNIELLSGDFGINSQTLKSIFNYMDYVKLFEIEGNKLNSEKLKNRLNKLFEKREKWASYKREKNEKNNFSTEKNNFSMQKNDFSIENERKSIVEIEYSRDREEIEKREEKEKKDIYIYNEIELYSKKNNIKKEFYDSFFNFYSSQGWKTSSGMEIENWKPKLKEWIKNPLTKENNKSSEWNSYNWYLEQIQRKGKSVVEELESQIIDGKPYYRYKNK